MLLLLLFVFGQTSLETMILVNKKLEIFPVCLFLDNRGLELKLDDHLVREQAFLGYKNIDFT